MLSKLAQLAYKQMFENTPAIGVDFNQMYTASGLSKLTISDFYKNERIHFTFLEQNPGKPSVYGKRAKNGAKILWVIMKGPNNKEVWLGRVENGVWYAK